MVNPQTPCNVIIEMFADIPLILFAKAPVEGKVKTRLVPALTVSQATRVAEVLLEETIKLVSNAWQGRIILAIWPDVNHPFVQCLLEKYPVECVVQGEGDLGEKMYHAMEAQGYPCVVMGCDVPHCEPVVLDDVYQALQDSKDVIGLTDDGGYYLLGLQSSCSALFQSIEWGADTVSKVTLAIAEQEKITFKQMKVLNDIDEHEDLVAASSQLPALARLLN